MFSVNGTVQIFTTAFQSIFSYRDTLDIRSAANKEEVRNVALRRFSEPVVKAAHSIARGIVRGIPSGKFSEAKTDVICAKLEELLLRVTHLATDKMQAVLPDIDQHDYSQAATAVHKRRDFGIKMASRFESFIGTCEQVCDVIEVEKKMTMASGGAFISSLNEGLKARSELSLYENEDLFYDRLKEDLYEALCRELIDDEITTKELQDVVKFFAETTLKSKIRELMVLAEKETIDPCFLKGLIGNILDACSESMELYFKKYLQQLESLEFEDVSINFDSSYGKAIMGLMRIMDPKIGTVRVSKFLEWYLGREKMLTGDDKLTRLLAQLTQASIEDTMNSNVSTWSGAIVEIIRNKFFDEHDNYIQRPGFIKPKDWEQLRKNPEYREQLNNPDSPLVKKLKVEDQKRVQADFRKSSIRLATAVSVASLVFEQYLLTTRQIAKETPKDGSMKSRAKIFVASVTSKVITLPFVRVVVELFFRLTIWIRVGLAKMIGYAAGNSLANRVSLFLESQAPSLLYRKLLIDVLEDVSILKESRVKQTHPLSSVAASNNETARVRTEFVEV